MSAKKYDQQNLYGISSETRHKMKLLSLSMNISMTKLVELMTERMWEEKSDTLVSVLTQHKANKNIHKVIKSLKPK